MTGITITHSPCQKGYYTGDRWTLQTRGITTWNVNDTYTIPNNALLYPKNDNLGRDRATIIFTNTEPKCYAPRSYRGTLSGADSSNLIWNAWRTGSDTTSATIGMTFSFNSVPYMNTIYLSGVATHGATQAFEFSGTCNPGTIHDPGENTLIFYNVSESTIQLDHLKMYRTYTMCNTNCVENISAHQGMLPAGCPKCVEGDIICSGGSYKGTHGPFDATRIDIPCNSLTCGGLSYTQWHDMTHAGGETLQPGSSVSWTLNFSTLCDNWTGKSICLINFNNIWPTSTSSGPDVEVALILTVNGTEHTINNYYLSKYHDHAISASYDLAQSSLYVDNGSNTVSLKNLGAVPIAVSPGVYGGVDVYRIYQSNLICSTNPPCQSCQTGCQTCESCECCDIACQTTCETVCQNSCETSCQSSCQSACQSCNNCLACYSCNVGCQEGCEVQCQDCQTGCEVSCQETCQLACQNCQTTCQTSCNDCQICQSCQEIENCNDAGYYTCQNCETCQPCYSCQDCETVCQNCQTTCELACQSCNTCQTTCELACQTGCQVSCQTGCQVSCQTGCEVSCQTGCEVTCQTGCQIACQSCNTCQTTCELACQTGCEVSCQSCIVCQTNEICPEAWYTCQDCETCQPCYSCVTTCQTGCEVSCQTGCQVSCQTCNTACQSCEICVACQTIEICPEAWYTCQDCETCQPAYT